MRTLTTAERIAWVLIWYRAAHEFHMDMLALLRGGPACSTRTPKSMRADWDVGRLRRAERCCLLAQRAYERADESLKDLPAQEREATAQLLLRWELGWLPTGLMVEARRIPTLIRSRHVDSYRALL